MTLVWPNSSSSANSDPWLVAHHDELVAMRPRVLVVNFVHGLREAQARRIAGAFATAVREASRGFLDYQPDELVDLGSPRGRVDRNSAAWPRDGVHLDYGELAAMLGLEGRAGVNEVWVLGDHTDRSQPWETVEVKRTYDTAFEPVGVTASAGNSGPHSLPWLGRSLRITYINVFRGVGCALENLGHTFERTAVCGALPWLEPYFREWAMLDLDTRYGLPFDSLYALGGREDVSYPTPTTLRWSGGDVENYVACGGNVHFLPNGRRDYDLDNPEPVMSTIETWRRPGSVPRPWTPRVLDRFRRIAPDCMGRWLVYWFRHMPGPSRVALDDDGRPMRNWWPLLFY